jgi:hypothetical protein
MGVHALHANGCPRSSTLSTLLTLLVDVEMSSKLHWNRKPAMSTILKGHKSIADVDLHPS